MDEDDFYHIILPIILVIFVISLIYITNAYGFDYINTNNGIWDHPPKVCFNPPAEKKWYIMRSIDAWRDMWYKVTGNKDLNFRMATIHPYPQMNCDIEIIDGNPSSIGARPDAIGAAVCMWRSDGYFFKCNIVISLEHQDYYSIVQHEMGHGLGLGHRMPFNVTGFAGVIVSNDIMMGQQGPFQKITNEDINTLIDFYGIDGFNNPEKVFIPKNYTIIHDKRI